LSRGALYQRFGSLFRVKPDVEVVKIAAVLRQIFGRHVISLPYRPPISDADRAECATSKANRATTYPGTIRAIIFPIRTIEACAQTCT